MAVGNVLGYAAGSFPSLYKYFPFALTNACDVYCANLKSCFIISVFLLLTVTTLALISVSENQYIKENFQGGGEESKMAFFGELFGALKSLPRPMFILLLVTALNWIAWFPFILYDTDWMAREIYGGHVDDNGLYDSGVRAGALGLMLQSVVLGFMSIGVELLARHLGEVKTLWGGINFILAIGLAMTVVVTKLASRSRRFDPSGNPLPPVAGVKAGALIIFCVLGIPLAVRPVALKPYIFPHPPSSISCIYIHLNFSLYIQCR